MHYPYHWYYDDRYMQNEWICRKALKDLEKEMARFPHRRQLLGQVIAARQALNAAEQLSKSH
jgi:hypothetical protein